MDWSFLDVFWAMCIFFAWVFWFWLLITVFGDLFRRHDISGGMKVLWTAFVIVLPFLGVFVYLISQGPGMAERRLADVQASQVQFDAQVRAAAGTGGPWRRSTRPSSCSTRAPSASPSSTPSRPRRSRPRREDNREDGAGHHGARRIARSTSGAARPRRTRGPR